MVRRTHGRRKVRQILPVKTFGGLSKNRSRLRVPDSQHALVITILTIQIDALVGNFAVFGKEQSTTGCGKCKQDAENNIEITGTVPLTAALLKEFKKGTLGGLGKENVLPWLRDNLHWRVTLADGTEKSREEIPGLKVSVVSTEITLPVGGFPVYSGVYEVHEGVTDGRPAGLNAGDHLYG